MEYDLELATEINHLCYYLDQEWFLTGPGFFDSQLILRHYARCQEEAAMRGREGRSLCLSEARISALPRVVAVTVLRVMSAGH